MNAPQKAPAATADVADQVNIPPLGVSAHRAGPADVSDLTQAQQIAAGDVQAFERLLRRFNRPLYRVARAIVKDDAEAEDVLQEAMLRAFRSMATFRGDAQLSTWLVRIVANEALARLRARTRRASVMPLHAGTADLDDFDASANEVPMPAQQDPEHSALRGEMRRLIEARIDALPDAFRVVFVLRALQELSVDETAACLAIPAATVRSRFFRARSLLREALSHDIDRAYDSAFEFGGVHCDRITARVLARIASDHAPPG